jgi:hypothetical protein
MIGEMKADITRVLSWTLIGEENEYLVGVLYSRRQSLAKAVKEDEDHEVCLS